MRSGLGSRRRSILAALVCSAIVTGALAGVGQSPASASHSQVTGVRGFAYGYHIKMNIFGGHDQIRGYGQYHCIRPDNPPGCAPQPADSYSPSVELPPSGGNLILVDPNGVFGTVGPAVIYSDSRETVTSEGSTGPDGSVTSFATVEGVNASGSEHLTATNMTSSCTASPAGVSGLTTVSEGVVTTDSGWDENEDGDYDDGSGEHPPTYWDVPAEPDPHTGVSGHLHIINPLEAEPERFRYVFNEQVVNRDASITVYGVHQIIYGPTAVGDLWVARSDCGVNRSPVAAADAYGSTAGTTLSVPAPGVLANDTDADGDALTAGSPSEPANGSVALGADGSFSYTPDAGFAGSDTFTYTVSDGHGGPETATVTIRVGSVNAVDDYYRTAASTPLTVPSPGVLDNDTDAQGDALSARSPSDPPNGAVTLNADGSFTYVPDAFFTGRDSFTYTAGDASGDTDTATVTITVGAVNDAPDAVDDAYTTGEDSPLTVPAPGVLANDSEPNGDAMSAASPSDPTNGAVSLNANGSFTYTPEANFAGTDSFTYTVTDDRGGTDTATVTINVAAVNDAPVAGDDTATTTEDTAVTVAAPGVVGNDTDVDGNALTATKAGDPANGTVSVNDDGSFTYTPEANFAGTDSFTYAVSDGQGGTDTGLVIISIAATNDDPVAVDETYATTEDTPLSVPAPGVLGNDTDTDGDALIAGSASVPAHGSVSIAPDGSFTYTPNAGFAGIDSFTYTASDGNGGTDTATVTITVTPPPPTGDTRPTQLSVSDVSVAEGNSGTTVATFTVSRLGVLSGPSTVKYKTTNGTATTTGADYTALPLATLSFAAGETSKTVTVDVAGDNLPEADETFTLTLSAQTGAALADTAGVATVLNDDGAAFLSIDSPSVSEGNSGTSPVTFTITRSGNLNGTSSFKYKTTVGNATVANGDYTDVPLTGPITFEPGQTAKEVVVNVTGDAVDEKNETFNLVLSAPVGATIADTSGTATIVDDDGPITPGPSTFLAVDNIFVTEGNEGTATAAFTVTRSGNTGGASTVKMATSGGTATAGGDYAAVAAGTTLSFAAGQATATVNVAVAGDTLLEKAETFNLVISTPTGATIADGSGTATILNDDGAAYLNIDDVSVTEGNAGTTAATFTLTRSGNTTGSSTVKYQTKTGTATTADFAAEGLSTVTFAAGETARTVTVEVTGDSADEVNERFTLVLSAPVGATVSDTSGTATIVDDD